MPSPVCVVNRLAQKGLKRLQIRWSNGMIGKQYDRAVVVSVSQRFMQEIHTSGVVVTSTREAVKETVGRRLREARCASGCTQAQVAALVEVSLRSLVRYEAGERLPNIETLMRLASAYGRPAEWFLETLKGG